MKSKSKKILTALTALVMTFSMGMSAGAESLLDFSIDTSRDKNNSAILNFDPENNTYELVDGEGNPVNIDNGEVETEEETLPEISSGETKTTIKKSGTAAVTSAPEIQAKTVSTTVTTAPQKWYIARYRDEIRSEIAARTTARTVTAIKRTTTTVKTTTTTTTTKKTTTTTKQTTKATTTTKKTTAATKARYDGIDVSRFQGDINWTKVKQAGIEFVMIRAGYGMYSDQVDAKFKENIAGAQKAGIDCGVYWYSYALSTADALKEAKVCYNTIKGYKLSYPVAFDIEDPSQMNLTTTQISNITKVFCDYLEDQKYYVTVYSFASLLNTKMNSSVLTDYDIWVAHTKVSKPSFSGNYGMWQYSHTGRVNGISGDVDLDYSYKYYPAIMKKNKLNGYT